LPGLVEIMSGEERKKIMSEKSVNGIYRLQTIAVAAIIPVFIIVYWIICSEKGVLNTSILASPDSVYERFKTMVQNGKLLTNVLVSTGRVLKGFALGALVGLTIGSLIGLFKPVSKLLSAMIAILRPIPPIAMIPFFILWLGIGEASKILIIALGTFWAVLLNTIQGFQDTDPKLLEVAKIFGKSKPVILLKIVLPSAVPSIFTGLRLGIGNAWSAVVAAEMIAASAGVGYMIQYARELVQPDLLLLGIITIGIIGLIIDTVVLYIQKKVVYWKTIE
jgi:sulfonate transport system permease protein